MGNQKIHTPRYFDIGKIKEFSIAFLTYKEKTAELSFFSTGENHGLTKNQLFDKFVKTHEWDKMYPANWHNELEATKKENEILVDNNNDLKDIIESLELELLQLKKETE